MPDGMGCYWDLPQEEGGNADRMLAPGESFRYNLHETDNDVRWSGTLWASTGCDKIDGCATGICYSPDTDHVCPAYVGPSGPTTKAEFTLSDSGIDFYDVSNIDGANPPVMIQPDRPVYPEGATSNSLKVSLSMCWSRKAFANMYGEKSRGVRSREQTSINKRYRRSSP